MNNLPTGTVTFLFTDIEGSTKLSAVKLLGAAGAIREKVQAPMTDFERIEYAQFVDRLQSMLPETEFNSLWEEGRELTIEQAIQFALDAVGETSGG